MALKPYQDPMNYQGRGRRSAGEGENPSSLLWPDGVIIIVPMVIASVAGRWLGFTDWGQQALVAVGVGLVFGVVLVLLGRRGGQTPPA